MYKIKKISNKKTKNWNLEPDPKLGSSKRIQISRAINTKLIAPNSNQFRSPLVAPSSEKCELAFSTMTTSLSLHLKPSPSSTSPSLASFRRRHTPSTTTSALVLRSPSPSTSTPSPLTPCSPPSSPPSYLTESTQLRRIPR